MIVKEYSIRIENLLRKIAGETYSGSDEILLNPYVEIISVLKQRIPNEKFDRFKLYYQAIEGKSLQELVGDEYYDVEQLIKDLKQAVQLK